MMIEQAAKSLDAELRRFSWFISVGIGESASGSVLFVYVRSQRHKELDKLRTQGWLGYSVVVRKVGNIRPVRSSASNKLKQISLLG